MAAPLRLITRHVFLKFARNECLTKALSPIRKHLTYTCVRHHSVWFRPMLFELNRQIKSILFKYGPEPLKPRSHQENWDYDSELFAFTRRIGEDIDDIVLREALRYSDIVPEGKTEAPALPLINNSALAETGSLFAAKYIEEFLSNVYPKFPTEGLRLITEFLMKPELLSHIARHLGIADLVQCVEFPVPEEVLKTTFLAVVGAIFEQQGAERTCAFVRDFVLTHLIGEEIYDIWNPEDPMGILMKMLEKDGRSLPESRLLREAGKHTLTPLYMVGVYSNRALLGWGPGETIDVAEKEAAAVALKNLLGIPENRPALPLDSVKHSHINKAVCRRLQERMDQRRISAS